MVGSVDPDLRPVATAPGSDFVRLVSNGRDRAANRQL